jgi:Anti-sigma factor NepR
MPGYSGFYDYDRREWLLAIGRRLRAEYDAVKEPVPERLAALIKQLETGTVRTNAPSRDSNAPRRNRSQ